MKIEKINENQIRCFITQEELMARQMKISELAYGTEKAKILFRELMTFAHKEYGFDPDNLPLMIEAVPLSQDTILLTVTKVAFPDELDSRFAYFSETEAAESLAAFMPGLGLGNGFHGGIDFPKMSTAANEILQVANDEKGADKELVRHFIFNKLNTVVKAAKVIGNSYHAENSLYKDATGEYHLILTIGDHTAKDFNKICNSLSEYGYMENPDSQSFTKITEHAKLISKPHALSDLSQL